MKTQELHVGMKVKHPQHGMGIVKAVTEITADIRFNDALHTIGPDTIDLGAAGAQGLRLERAGGPFERLEEPRGHGPVARDELEGLPGAIRGEEEHGRPAEAEEPRHAPRGCVRSKPSATNRQRTPVAARPAGSPA